jgi:hypothetical protein
MITIGVGLHLLVLSSAKQDPIGMIMSSRIIWHVCLIDPSSGLHLRNVTDGYQPGAEHIKLAVGGGSQPQTMTSERLPHLAKRLGRVAI